MAQCDQIIFPVMKDKVGIIGNIFVEKDLLHFIEVEMDKYYT